MYNKGRRLVSFYCLASPSLNKVDTYIRTYVHTYLPTYVHTYIRTYVHTNIRTYVHTYIRTYVHTYIRTYVHTYIRTYVHTYVNTYLRTYVPTYIRTYVLAAFTFNSYMYQKQHFSIPPKTKGVEFNNVTRVWGIILLITLIIIMTF